MDLIGGDTLLFADKIKKTNMFEWTQERVFVITNNACYNIHKKSIKRCIPIKEIGGLTKTVPPSKNAGEFTIHVPREYDYRYISTKREQILDTIKRAYIVLKQTNCPLFGVPSKDLKDFTTTEKDMKKSVSRFPPNDFRVLSEDLLK